MAKADRPKYNYPFVTKAQLLAAQAADDNVVLQHLSIVHGYQTQDERDAQATKYSNGGGFMSSHASNGSRIAKAHLAGEALSDEDMALARKIAGSYGKQLAAHFRAKQIAENPELRRIAEIFSAG